MIDGFDEALAAFGRQVVETHRRACIKTAADIHRRLVDRSPVDSGAFRRDWAIDVGEAKPREFVKAEPGKSFPPLRTDFAALETAPNFPLLTVSDVAPYAEKLAEGHSPQAPEGWVDLAVEEAAAALGRP